MCLEGRLCENISTQNIYLHKAQPNVTFVKTLNVTLYSYLLLVAEIFHFLSQIKRFNKKEKTSINEQKSNRSYLPIRAKGVFTQRDMSQENVTGTKSFVGHPRAHVAAGDA